MVSGERRSSPRDTLGRTGGRGVASSVLVFLAVVVTTATVTILVASPRDDSPSSMGRPAPTDRPSSLPGKQVPVARIFPLEPIGSNLTVGSAGLQITAELSPFQLAALRSPGPLGQLKTDLTMSLLPYYEQASRCQDSRQRSTLEFAFQVRSNGLSANVFGGRFAQITSGAPLTPDVIACVERAMNQPFTMLADADRPFPEGIEGELSMELVLGAP